MAVNGKLIQYNPEYSHLSLINLVNTFPLKIVDLISKRAKHVLLGFSCLESCKFLIFLLWKHPLLVILLPKKSLNILLSRISFNLVEMFVNPFTFIIAKRLNN